jgi:hypothetical protein
MSAFMSATGHSIYHAIDSSKEPEAAWFQLHLYHPVERTRYLTHKGRKTYSQNHRVFKQDTTTPQPQTRLTETQPP